MLSTDYPACYAKQKNVPSKFSKISYAGFNNYTGCIDSLLIWINKLSNNDSVVLEAGIKKFFCRHKKIRLSMQGICGTKCRFLDAPIDHPDLHLII